jgi:predicted short-subunit dehydrogenase-like oxidoreductase (DUF2520 family)
MEQPTYGIVGRGRLATHLARYFELESRSFLRWHRGMPRRPADALREATTILLAISDDALEPFLAGNPELTGNTLAHFSGSRAVEGVAGLHPLMTFGPEPYDLDTYRSIPFVSEKGGKAFDDVFPGFLNPSYTMDPELKPLYHALCVMAGNFPTLLWSKVFGEFEERLDLPPEILRPYIAQTLGNTFESAGKALTGPLARGDRGTVERNLAALGDDSYAGIYRAFARSHGMQEI